VRLAVRDADLSGYLQPVLAAGVVRYVGEPVAVVVAGDPYAAEDAAELVEIDIEEEPAVLDAAAAGPPRLAAAVPGRERRRRFHPRLRGHRNRVRPGRARGGDRGRDRAAHRRAAGARVLLAEPDPRTGGLAIFGMTKVPVFNRDLLATMLGIDRALIHVHAIDAGGGFGVRGEFYPEDYLVPWLARTLGRPGQVGGGPRRAPGRREPLPAAVAPGRCRVRLSRPDHRA
jgi:carbon-monoxide dehydrogenase large subunit/6-hydroxypseudooxynicotine dehydrogenase subunit gamma